MRLLLQAGLAAQGEAYYIHPGELDLCLFNWLDGHDPWQQIYLWDDPGDPNHLQGWALLSTPWSSFDVFVQPGLWGSPWAGEVNAWVEGRSIEQALKQGHRQVWRMNVAETDVSLQAHLSGRGFEREPIHDMLLMRCELGGELPQVSIPAGYAVRPVDERYARSRAAAQHAAFKVDKPFSEYLEQYQHFMASPAYCRGRDWAVVTVEGDIAAFCSVWPDEVSLTGMVDPVGTHPGHQRKGLGRAILVTGLGELRSAGLHSAQLCVRNNNVAAIRLYESVGFRLTNRLLTYKKSL